MKCLFFIFIIGCDFYGFSQLPNKPTSAIDLSRIEYTYKIATQFSDTANMINTLLYIVSCSPDNTSRIKELCLLYYNSGNMTSALKVGQKYLSLVEDDIDILKICASMYHIRMQYNDALLAYTELFYRTSNPLYKYHSAYIEYEMYRQHECIETIEQCLNMVKDKDVSISISNYEGLVSLKAACLNLKGLAYIDLKDFLNARICFENALKISPKFLLATDNLRRLKNL